MKKVIEEILAGDKEKFREIIHQISPMVRVYFASRVFDTSSIEDLCQETFLGIFQSLKSYNNDMPFNGWALGIASNKLKMYYRMQATRKKAHDKLESEVREVMFPELPDFEPSELSVKMQRLKECLEQSPSRLKTIFKLRYFQKVSVLEISKNYKTTETAISSLLYRSKKKLSTCMDR